MKAIKSLIALVAAPAIIGFAACTSTEHLKSLDKAGLGNPDDAKVDFYDYVNAKWQKDHPLTDEFSRYGQFNILSDTNEVRVKNLVMGLAASNPEPGTVDFKVATIYEQAMDSTRRNAEGAAPIQADLKKIEETPHEGMTDLLMWMHANYGSPFFGAGPMEDMKNSTEYAMYVSSGGMGLGDRDYYLKNDERNTAVRNAYKTLIASQMKNAGYSQQDADRIVASVMKIETALADSAWTREQSRNIPAMYNPRTFAELKSMFPNIAWDRYFKETMGIETPIDTVIVTEISSLNRANQLIGSLSDREIKDYYLWEYVSNAAPYLSDAFSDASFEFNKVMSGVKEQRPRWKRALSATEGSLGEAIGQLYVRQYFPESSKKQMLDLVENLREALGQHIDSLTWMSDATKAKAQEKLKAFTVKIGYPDKWKDYSSMEIDPKKSYYENMHAVSMWHQRDRLSKWGKPVDRTEWAMTPQTINAYYNPMANEIVFPAGILQAPFFDPEASDAENYGGIGVVIGHEMTHGFDDQGCNFDAQGNMVNWWTPEDAAAFRELTQGLADQYSAVEVLPGLTANGVFTLGENIADHGGVRIARTAFLNAQKKKGVDVEKTTIDGLKPMQVFYLNFANLWAQNIRDEEISRLTAGDPHSLGKLRVNVTLRNFAPFFEAFDIKEGDAMFRPEQERIIIW